MTTYAEKTAMLLAEATKWIGTKETSPNGGKTVEMFQSVIGIAQGESWCFSFVQYCLKEVDKKCGSQTWVPQTEHVMTGWDRSRGAAKLPLPEPGCLVVWQKHDSRGKPTISGHIGIVVSVNKGSIVTIEGNTSDGVTVNRDGDGVYKRTRTLTPTGSLIIKGFLRCWAVDAVIS